MDTPEIQKKLKDITCKDCGSKRTYYRKKTNDHLCQKCGVTYPHGTENQI